MTEKYYFIDMLCFETTATIVALDDEKSSVILDKTIFHVKGGGQLADSGTINDAIVLDVIHREDGAVLHQVSREDLQKLSANLNVTIKIDSVKRKYHSRLHSAGHVIAGVVEKLFPEIKAISGNHIPGQSRIVFSGQLLLEKEEFLSEISKELKRHNHAVVDLVISSIPFSILKPAIREDIVNNTFDMLRSSGKFIIFQYSPLMLSLLKKYFDANNVSTQFELRNIPPMFIMSAQKLDLTK